MSFAVEMFTNAVTYLKIADSKFAFRIEHLNLAHSETNFLIFWLSWKNQFFFQFPHLVLVSREICTVLMHVTHIRLRKVLIFSIWVLHESFVITKNILAAREHRQYLWDRHSSGTVRRMQDAGRCKHTGRNSRFDLREF